MSQRYGVSVVVMIRHPAAIANSLKRLGWGFQFSNLLRQELLMSGLLAEFESTLKQSPLADCIIDQSALLWRILYYTVSRYKENHPDWLFVRQEDLARRPENEFEVLFNRLGLEFTARAREFIRAHTASSNPGQSPLGRKDNLKRDALLTTTLWKEQLNAEQIDRVRRQVQDVSQYWYSEFDW